MSPRVAEPGESAETAISVSVLAESVKSIVEGSVPPVWIRGEVTGFKKYRSGHWYFALRDGNAQISCMVWASDTARIPAAPDEGMQVTAYGRLGVYAARTEIRFSILRLAASGDGLWRKAFEEARAKLDADGLLDPARKRPLPRYPRTIAVITSTEGAALHDIVSVARRRDPTICVVVIPAAVQGETAPKELVRALRRASHWDGADLVIIGRGGGSREDLWAFNDERVARAVAMCRTPTISAVGHEVDVSLTDLVADLRAATPSAAAETAVPERAKVVHDLERMGSRLRGALSLRAERARSDLARASRDLAVRARRAVELRRSWLAASAATIDALSPLRTLERGYVVARDADGRTLSRVRDFVVGEEFGIVAHDGSVRARTVDVKPEAT
ncbi:MAG TPA: exodeoxyribonuclease VII large subunit [Gemmatimonadaceae bacterium]|nr:exodeoxyribonuclease VII large subunit [Gemmatimonadaceae bacterium]